MRLFFAIELPPDVQAALGRLKVADSPDYRWVDPALVHVTLAFLGEQPVERVAELQHVGGVAARAARPAVLKLGQAGAFGPRRAPRVLWIGLAGDLAALEGLQARLASGLGDAHFLLEDRPFRPHVTLARRRASAQGGAPAGWPPATGPAPDRVPMRELTLFESRLSSRGAAYLPLARFPLGDPSG